MDGMYKNYFIKHFTWVLYLSHILNKICQNMAKYTVFIWRKHILFVTSFAEVGVKWQKQLITCVRWKLKHHTYVPNFMTIYQIFVEIFGSGPKQWANRQMDIAIHRTMSHRVVRKITVVSCVPEHFFIGFWLWNLLSSAKEHHKEPPVKTKEVTDIQILLYNCLVGSRHKLSKIILCFCANNYDLFNS